MAHIKTVHKAPLFGASPHSTPAATPSISGWRLGLAYVFVAIEQIWGCYWPLTALWGAWLGLALAGIIALLPFWLHGLLLLGLVAATVFLGWRASRHLSWPNRYHIWQRMEKAGAILHQPSLQLIDKLPSTMAHNPTTQALWALQQQKNRVLLRGMRVFWPRPVLLPADHYCLLPMALMLALLGLAVARGNWQPLQQSFLPQWPSMVAMNTQHISGWAVPPQYTALPPILLAEGGSASPVAIPIGSAITITANGDADGLKLVINREHSPLKKQAEDSWKAEANFTGGDSIAVASYFFTKSRWPVQAVADAPPRISFKEYPTINQQNRINIALDVQDDYGVKDIIIKARLADVEQATSEILWSLTLSPTLAQKQQLLTLDLTSHYWAGNPVILWAEASDAAAHTAKTDEVRLSLPEKTFNNKIAKLLIEERKRLEKTPQDWLKTVETLHNIAAKPQEFNEDSSIYLGLKVASQILWRLGSGEHSNINPENIEPVRQMLWQMALALENSSAGAKLQAMQRQLEEMLQSQQTTPKQLSESLQRLQQAMGEQFAKSLQELQKKMAKAGLKPEDFANQPAEDMGNNLSQTLKDMQKMAEMGDKQGMAEKLNELQQMMENVQKTPTVEELKKMAEMNKLAQKLKDITQKQQSLLDKTYPSATKGRYMSEQDGQQLQQLGQEQQNLRKELGDAMQQMDEAGGDIPKNLQEADKHMRESRQNLQQEDAGAAVFSQNSALKSLQEGAEKLGQQQRKMSQGMLVPMPLNNAGNNKDKDPFGRKGASGKDLDDERVKVPEEIARERAREILQQLRNRSGDQHLSPMEREYLEGLMKQF
ncbi:MAG: DUF4175 domain-containing protein [Alphaproteobacteria bacterium]